MPIELLPGIGKRTAKILRSLDIRTIGEFKRTPEKVLVEIFGPSIRSLHHYVHSKSAKQVATGGRVHSRTRQKTMQRSWSQKIKFAASVLSLI